MKSRSARAIVIALTLAACGGDGVGVDRESLQLIGDPFETTIVERLPDPGPVEHAFEVSDTIPGRLAGIVAFVRHGRVFEKVGPDDYIPLSVDRIEPEDRVELWYSFSAERSGGLKAGSLVRIP